MPHCIAICFIVLAWLPALCAEQQRVYFIGNSLTASTTLDRVWQLSAQRGIDLQFGSQVSGGKSLIRHLNYTTEPGQKWVSWECSKQEGERWVPGIAHNDPLPKRFGLYDTALVKHQWDAVVLQPYMSSLHDDVAAITSFIDLAVKHDSTKRFHIYATWPSRKKIFTTPDKSAFTCENIDYAALWLSDYTATIDDSGPKAFAGCASRDYYATLLGELHRRYPELAQAITLIPAGEVLYELDLMIKAGTLPGIQTLAQRKPTLVPGLSETCTWSHGINVLYADPIHLNPIPHQASTLGIFVSGSTVQAALSGTSPVGLSAAAYGLDDQVDQALITAIQETIWRVLSR